jgi:hypothetical protein
MLIPFSHAHVFCFMQLRGDGESVLSQDDDPHCLAISLRPEYSNPPTKSDENLWPGSAEKMA